MTSTTPTTDTTPDALAVQLDCLRRMSPHDRLSKTFAWSRDIREMTFRAIRRRNPTLDENGVRLRFIELVYGKELADEVRQWQTSAATEAPH
jgi:hypothetical protein